INSHSPSLTTQSLRPEFRSLMKRSAKFGHGTKSNFMPMPVLAVKSFDSSTSALAGSQADQHKVRSDASALVSPAVQTKPIVASAVAVLRNVFMSVLPGFDLRSPEPT